MAKRPIVYPFCPTVSMATLAGTFMTTQKVHKLEVDTSRGESITMKVRLVLQSLSKFWVYLPAATETWLPMQSSSRPHSAGRCHIPQAPM